MAKNKLIVALAVCATMAACTSKDNQDSSGKASINSNAIVENQNLTPTEKAEQLALAAEQLVSGTSFMYADAVAETALTFDAKNKRAQLIRALVGPAMTTKGIIERVKPIAYRNEKSKARHDEFLKELDKKPNHALKTFLLAGQADIKTEKDIQSFFGELTSAVERLRLFFKNNKDLQITLNVPGEKQQERIVEREYDKCFWTRTSDGTYVSNCDLRDVLQIKLERADIEGMQHIVAGYEIYLKLMNAYSLSGAFAVGDKFKGTEVSSKLVREELLKNAEFATLRTSAGLNSIVQMGLDAIAGVRWAKQLQNTLCPAGEQVQNTRPGFALSDGICIPERAEDNTPIEDVLKNVEFALNGGLVDATWGGQHGKYQTQIKPVSVLQGSIKDVRDLGLIFDECDRVVAAGDSTLGGVFVKKDANAVLSINRRKCDQ